jgi:peptidoglycan/LPS O-acetylase OafA/YrhL
MVGATLAKPQATTEPARFYLRELDALRAFAFLSVFLSHYFMELGWSPRVIYILGHGVDLFFTLSAYLITELLLREKDRFGHIDIKGFYIRRILRIWPLYFAFLAFVLLLKVIAAPRGIPYSVLTLFAVFLGDTPGSSQIFISPILFPLWSISLEEQFYLTWPHIVQRISRRQVGLFGISLWGLCIVMRLLYYLTGVGHVFLVVLLHVDSMAIGLVISSLKLQPERHHLVALAAGVACWIFSALYIVSDWNLYPISLTLAHSMVPIGCGAFLLGAMNAAWLQRAWLVYLGRISYGLYIYHGAALSAMVIVCASLPSGCRSLVSFSAGLALTIALAAASYRWYESPFLQLKARYQHVPSLIPPRGADEAMPKACAGRTGTDRQHSGWIQKALRKVTHQLNRARPL